MTDSEFRVLATVGDVTIVQEGKFLIAMSRCCLDNFWASDSRFWRCTSKDCTSNVEIECISPSAFWLVHTTSPTHKELNEWLEAWIGPGYELSLEW